MKLDPSNLGRGTIGEPFFSTSRLGMIEWEKEAGTGHATTESCGGVPRDPNPQLPSQPHKRHYGWFPLVTDAKFSLVFFPLSLPLPPLPPKVSTSTDVIFEAGDDQQLNSWLCEIKECLCQG